MCQLKEELRLKSCVRKVNGYMRPESTRRLYLQVQILGVTGRHWPWVHLQENKVELKPIIVFVSVLPSLFRIEKKTWLSLIPALYTSNVCTMCMDDTMAKPSLHIWTHPPFNGKNIRNTDNCICSSVQLFVIYVR